MNIYWAPSVTLWVANRQSHSTGSLWARVRGTQHKNPKTRWSLIMMGDLLDHLHHDHLWSRRRGNCWQGLRKGGLWDLNGKSGEGLTFANFPPWPYGLEESPHAEPSIKRVLIVFLLLLFICAGKAQGLRSQLLGLKSWLCHQSAGWPQAPVLSSLNSCLHICEIEITSLVRLSCRCLSYYPQRDSQNRPGV